MTQQETIDQLIRIHLGDLIVQIVMHKAQIAELEKALIAEQAKPKAEPEEKPEPEIIVNKPNGRQEKRVQDG